MIVYLDTSVILRCLLNQTPLWKKWGRWESAYTSQLTRVEAFRSVDRLRMGGHLDDAGVAQVIASLNETLAHVHQIKINDEVLHRSAQPYPTLLRSLDAIHMASALLWRDTHLDTPLVFVTHDRQQQIAARALGFDVEG